MKTQQFRSSILIALSGVWSISQIARANEPPQLLKRVPLTEPEASGRFYGCSWADYDNDGWLDLFVASGWGQKNALFHNTGNGRFERITTGAIATDVADANGAAWADYDNDGDLDIYVANFESPAEDLFYRNNGDGTFTRVVNGPWSSDQSWGNSPAWGDYDRDGYVDLIVANAGPRNNDFLFKNNGDGTFTKITTGPIVTTKTNSGTPSWVDYDNDGDADLFKQNIGTVPDHLFRNDGSGQFTRILTSIVTGGGEFAVGSWGDYDNDGFLDTLAVYGNSKELRLFRNLGNGTFDEISNLDLPSGGFGSWADVDNDGDLDLFITRSEGGHEALYENNGDGTFSARAIPDLGGNTYGADWGDFDNDGFLDVVLSNGGGQKATDPEEEMVLLHNEAKNLGNTNSWLKVKLRGIISNRSALGAIVRAKATLNGKAVWQMRLVGAGAPQLTPHFGFGSATRIDVVRVEWPSGVVQELKNIQPNRVLNVEEPPMLEILNLKHPGADPSGGHFRVRGIKDSQYFIQVSEDLVRWTDIGSVKGDTVFTDWTIVETRNYPRSRFYRVFERLGRE